MVDVLMVNKGYVDMTVKRNIDVDDVDAYCIKLII